jgi:hypothetical protein
LARGGGSSGEKPTLAISPKGTEPAAQKHRARRKTERMPAALRKKNVTDKQETRRGGTLAGEPIPSGGAVASGENFREQTIKPSNPSASEENRLGRARLHE